MTLQEMRHHAAISCCPTIGDCTKEDSQTKETNAPRYQFLLAAKGHQEANNARRFGRICRQGIQSNIERMLATHVPAKVVDPALFQPLTPLRQRLDDRHQASFILSGSGTGKREDVARQMMRRTSHLAPFHVNESRTVFDVEFFHPTGHIVAPDTPPPHVIKRPGAEPCHRIISVRRDRRNQGFHILSSNGRHPAIEVADGCMSQK